MTDDLSRLMDETPINADAGIDDVQSTQAPPSPTALKLDRWSMRRGKDWSTKTKVAPVVGDDLTRNPIGNRERFLADMLAAAWDPYPQLADNTEVPHLQHFISTMMQTPDYQSLHAQTRLDDIASEIAAASFAKQYIEYAKEDGTSPDTQPSEGESEDDKLDRDAKALGAAKAAMTDAKKDVQQLNDMRDGLGGDGADPSTMNAERVRELFSQVRSNRQLRKIMELAGRYIRLAQSMQRSKTVHGADETVGIEYSDDLSRILASEYAYLDDEDLELEFFRRFTERSLMSREVKSTEDEARGPIVLVVDESGSMRGDKVEHAKAMALAILWVAEHQKRWACLVGFAGATSGNFLVVPPGKRDINSLVAWLEHFFGGGTSCDVPLDVLPSKWEELGCPAGKTDIIQITDAIVDVPADTVERFISWKIAHEVKMNTIVIGAEPGDMAQVSDRWWSVNQLDLETDGVSQCLSV